MTHTLGPKPNFIIVGLALFSMFFGSGNLIFPLMLGRDAGADFLISSIGFILTAVIIPLLGVIAIAYAKGSYDEVFSKAIKGKLKIWLVLIVLISFVPLGAGPRCVVLSFASLKNFLPMPSLYIFSFFFLSFCAYLINDRKNLLDVLGKILTPMLILCVLAMVISALMHGHMDKASLPKGVLFKTALIEGYNTQDLFSSIFFSSSLILLISPYFNHKKDLTITLLKGSFVSIILLASIYISLIGASSLHSDILLNKSGIELVSILAKYTMGDSFGIVASLAVALACLTTAVALILSFSDFLNNHFIKNKKIALSISLISVYLTSLIEFEQIRSLISILMQIIYPIIIFIVLRYLSYYYFHHKKAQNNP